HSKTHKFMTNHALFSANYLSIYHTPALGDTSYDTLAFEFKVIQSLLPYRTVLLGEIPFSKKELQEGHFEDIIIGEHFNCHEHSA
ncbi:hypothetical protein, partial [Neobacillus drentensis]|uniref:hypothetical protein n=1 Tax=Neobacillus drentensis TaxID=220684 RepID=UPI003001380A